MKRATIAAAFLVLCAAAAPGGETSSTWVDWTERRAAELEARGEYEDAIEEWTVLAQLQPRAVEPLSRAAVLCVEVPVLRGKELTPGSPMFIAAERFVRAGIVRGGQFDAGLAYAVGRLHLAKSKWGDAWRTLTDATNWGFDPVRARWWQYRAAVNRAAMLIDTGRAQEAMEDLERLRKEQPGHVDERFLLIDLAVANHHMQQPEEAKKILDAVLAADPGAADALYLRGVILADQGLLEDAEKTFSETLLHATATYADRTYRNALVRLADVQVKLGKLDEAEATAKRLLDVAKDDPEALFALGRVRQARNDLDGALKLFRRVARMNPESERTLGSLQQVLHLLGLDDEAAEVGKRIEAMDRKHAAAIESEFPGKAGGGR
jgi:tetratricopeptide (TPR) repeat protein